ncbi:MAG: ComF family protein [Lachnospiraceae bacterium]|nr:ComF family protein [Lachnospiraceae bacterium]
MILTRLLFPARCPVCHDLVRGDGRICPECRQLLSYVKGPVCCKCGKELRFEEEELCLDCRLRKKSFDGGIALLNYDDIARESMVKFKYGQRKEYGLFYAEEIARLYKDRIRHFGPDGIIPVPVHISRLRFRGYNQAQVVAERLGELLSLPVYDKALIRTKKTVAQKELNAVQRMRNLMSAMETGPGAKNLRKVLLVDDIYTTGSTMEACTRVLRAAGVQEVMPVCVCIGHSQV